MKPESLLHQSKLLFASGLCAALLMAQPVLANGKPMEDEPADTKAKAKTTTSRNNSAVKIYPDIIKRNMHVVAKDNDGKEIDFFVFDLQGTLMQNFKMKEKAHLKIAGLARGKYIYRVFSGDMETANGEFEIR
jgi:hypothetical protein